MTRAERRYRKERKKAWARRTFPDDPAAYKLADNPAFCRKLCCRSRKREFAGPTMRELRAANA